MIDTLNGGKLNFKPRDQAQNEIEAIFQGYSPPDISPEQLVNQSCIPGKVHEGVNRSQIFYFWYECRFKTEIFVSRILPSLPRNRSFHSWYTRIESLEEEVYYESLNHLQSSRFEGFSVYHEWYHDILGDISNFSFQEFRGLKFVEFLIERFPYLDKIEHPNGICRRFYTNECSHWQPKSNVNSPFRRYREFLKQYSSSGLEYNERFGFLERLPALPKDHPQRGYGMFPGIRSRIPENLIRDKHGINRIGEGWVSETLLFKQIAERLNVTVEQHGSPKWLKAQHFDVWIPDFAVAIEYHGKQHFEPVDFFGGVEAFEANKERDKRKRQLCIDNNVHLIVVRKGYDINELMTEIRLKRMGADV